MGYIYIMTNPVLHDMVKIGYPLPELTFYDNGKEVEKIAVLPSTEIDYPVLSDRGGKHFLGWESDNSGIFTEGEMPLYSSSLTAVYGNYIKYFEADGSEIEIQLIPESKKS